ncbi:MAG TPA: carboxypeptidase-like regulatory domain-containing protein [Tepidisphaeraceae bacterium]
MSEHQPPTWRFRTIDEDQKHVEPTHREHLAPGGAVEPLVRESIQNSLDAPVEVEGRPTRMTFTLGHVNASVVAPFFDALRPHLGAITRSLPEGLPPPSEPVNFLSIEDSNTKGLEGDPSLRKPLQPDGTKNHFFRFWHSVGQSAGDFKRRGSWGVGKVVFSNASRIRTFFGVTRRPGDAAPLLMGEAGLTIHTLPDSDTLYDWYGYYAIHQPRQNHYVPLPVRNGTVDDFLRAFGLSRTATGLSIVVPYVREEVKLNDLARSVIEQYFLPILAGRLEVTVRDPVRSIQITHATIDNAVSELTWPPKGPSIQSEMAALLRLARWQINLPSEDYILLNSTGSEGAYVLTKDRFPEGALLRASDSFAANDRVAFRVPIQVRPKNGGVVEEEVRIVLERDETLRTSNVPHLRSGMHISKLRTQGATSVRGLLLVGIDPVTQGALDKLLQASEGPAHINWELQGEGYDKAKLLYDDARRTISFMRNIVRSLADLLAAPEDDRDVRTLSVFFPDYNEAGNAGGPIPGPRPMPGPEDPGAPPPLPRGVIEVIVHSLAPRGLRPVEAATVRLHADGSSDTADAIATTDGEGRVRFHQLAPGQYQISAQKPAVGEALALTSSYLKIVACSPN